MDFPGDILTTLNYTVRYSIVILYVLYYTTYTPFYIPRAAHVKSFSIPFNFTYRSLELCFIVTRTLLVIFCVGWMCLSFPLSLLSLLLPYFSSSR